MKTRAINSGIRVRLFFDGSFEKMGNEIQRNFPGLSNTGVDEDSGEDFIQIRGVSQVVAEPGKKAIWVTVEDRDVKLTPSTFVVLP